MVEISEIKIVINDREIVLNAKDARELHNELNTIFGGQQTYIIYPTLCYYHPVEYSPRITYIMSGTSSDTLVPGCDISLA